jgi:hypothetical protein
MNYKFVLAAAATIVLLAGCGNANADKIKQICIGKQVAAKIEKGKAESACSCYSDYLKKNMTAEQVEAYSILIGGDETAYKAAEKAGKLKSLDGKPGKAASEALQAAAKKCMAN